MDSLKDPVAEIVHNQPTTEQPEINFITRNNLHHQRIYFESPTNNRMAYTDYEIINIK